jgi:putative ATPase
MAAMGYGEGYQHAHEREQARVDMECLPELLAGRRYYHPTERGVEQRIKQRLEERRKKR